VGELESALKKSKKQIKALQSLAQADGNGGGASSSEATAQVMASLAAGDSRELEAAQASREAAEKRCEALEAQLSSQRENVRSLEGDVRKAQAAVGAAAAKGKGGKEQAAAAAAAAAAAEAAVAAAEENLEVERQAWQQTEATIRETHAAELQVNQISLPSSSPRPHLLLASSSPGPQGVQAALAAKAGELTALQASSAAVAAARGDAVQSLKAAQDDLEMETAARKAAQARADEAEIGRASCRERVY
jgi:SWI/SNF-related matrix-associated actin-dependent regulator 1 of chromatin subfamily A